jgi:PAS domain S-box-containing protein
MGLSKVACFTRGHAMEDRGKSRDKLIDELRELRETHDALRKERDFAESILETAQVIVLVLDPEGRVMRFNRYMEELSGYALEEVKGCEWFTTFLPENERGRIRELYGHSLEGRQACGNINAIVTKDGRLRDIEWYDHTLRDGQGGVVGVLAIGQDVTEHRRNEERILRQQYLLEKARSLGRSGPGNSTCCRTGSSGRTRTAGSSVFRPGPWRTTGCSCKRSTPRTRSTFTRNGAPLLRANRMISSTVSTLTVPYGGFGRRRIWSSTRMGRPSGP